MNFSFLKRDDGRYDLFADACIEAEKIYATAPAMCAVGCRKALELAVRWVYAADNTISLPYKDNLSSLLHEESFKNCVDERVWRSTLAINKLGNMAVHTEKKVRPQDAILSLRALFAFVDWLDYCYGPDYVERSFDEEIVPSAGAALSSEQIATIKQNKALLSEKEEIIKKLEDQVKAMADELTQAREQNIVDRSFNPDEISEYETRVLYIDTDLKLAGWDLNQDVLQEREVHGMPVEAGDSSGKGFIDYLLLGKDGKPLAILEAKRTMYSPQKGLQQARLYAQCLQEEYGYAPPIFLSNGYETFFVDDQAAPMRKVSGVFSQGELQTIMNRRGKLVPLSQVQVNTDIAGDAKHYYQMEAIRKVCNNIEEGHRKSLLVMATGTGKTRVSAALVDVLMRGNRVKNVLFLADRVALVSQAKYAFQQYLPNESLCNLCKNKDERDARIVFSTYPTILNAIDSVRNEEGNRMYTPAHFDLIVIDEAHRSIFKKYKEIFEYFDAFMVGLTATPVNEVDRNTYDFFEVERGVPTYVYEYATAVYQDHVLVPFTGIETHTSFLDEGITYADLSPEEQEALEEAYQEEGEEVPEYIPESDIDVWLFNDETVDGVLQMLMEKGIHVDGGETIGKTIIFAANRKHAEFIVERFGKLYPHLPGDYIKHVMHDYDYSHTIIDEFKLKGSPRIVVSVDMMDTGVDVPEIVNLVFFKKVRSKIKFWQMIGRGTRLCPNLDVVDPLDEEHPGGAYADKERFFIFDWCRNFEFFNEGGETVEGRVGASLSEAVFCRQVQLIKDFQHADYAGLEWEEWRGKLVEDVHGQVQLLDEELVSVRLRRPAVQKFKQEVSYVFLNDADLSTLQTDIAPLVHNDESDIDALRFDALMYGFMCSLCEGAGVGPYRSRLLSIASGLQEMITIPQVKDKLPLLQRITSEGFFEDITALVLEKVRKELRGIIRFLVGNGPGRKVIYTKLSDPVTEMKINVGAMPEENFDDYKLKVNRYLSDFAGNAVIAKLHHNEPLDEGDLEELERLFTQELGTAEDYSYTYGETPFGLLVRSIVKLDREAAMEAFAEFINDEELNNQQIAFVHRVIDYIVANGFMEPEVLAQPPFDRPQSFARLFDRKRQELLVSIIRSVKDNALPPAA
ncbi:MAG: DEAD/DEAH box helicase family protein [Eggerthellaceae bacterium]|nr:DEAD/DEAH box helicase family protein [Eggerthellaceae bacterium]